ncbi:MAG TPA: hypothetical protein VFZ61_29695 [Polyangiales bacterium]
MSKYNMNRAVLGGLAFAASCAAWSLSAANVEAGEWHTNWGTTPLIRLESDNGSRHGWCEYSLPDGEPQSYAHVGVHPNSTWVALRDWVGNLGYSPEAMSYYLCTGYQGTSSWHSSPFFPLWRYTRPDPRYVPFQKHTVFSGEVDSEVIRPEDAPGVWYCPSEHPVLIAAYCQTRAWW